MNNKKCLLLGASGFIASNSIEKLSSVFEEVIAVSRKRLHFGNYPNVVTAVGDIRDDSFINEITQNIDCVVNMATSTTPVSSNLDPISDVENNLIVNIKLVQACIRNNVKKLVFLSSGGTVYGDLQHVPKGMLVNEHQLVRPVSSYGIVKFAIENYIQYLSRNSELKTISLRVSNPYGPTSKVNANQGLIPNLINKYNLNESVIVWGDGLAVRDYIHVNDVRDAVIKACFYEGMFDVFNISSGTGFSINEVIEIFNETLPNKLDVKYDLSSGKAGVSYSVLDCSLAQQELNWRPSVDFRDGISSLILQSTH